MKLTYKDTKEYYSHFTSDQIELIEELNKNHNKVVALSEVLDLAQDMLGSLHAYTIELRKLINIKCQESNNINDKMDQLGVTDILVNMEKI